MKVYLIAEVSVNNKELFSEYLTKIARLVKKHEGEYLVKGGSPASIEGDWRPEKMVVIEFPCNSNLDKFMSDSEVKDVFTLRHKSSVSSLISVTGCN